MHQHCLSSPFSFRPPQPAVQGPPGTVTAASSTSLPPLPHPSLCVQAPTRTSLAVFCNWHVHQEKCMNFSVVFRVFRKSVKTKKTEKD
jgi:hypothetical protein